MIQLFSDWSDFEREMTRLDNMPDFKMRTLLDTVLRHGFAMTQADVHVQTDSLRGSGKAESEVDKIEHEYEGEISYGGPSSGPNNPVDYAIYEKRREPDEHGDHDFMRRLETLDIEWREAIKMGLSR